MKSNDNCVEVCNKTTPDTALSLDTWCLLVSNANSINAVYASIEIEFSAGKNILIPSIEVSVPSITYTYSRPSFTYSRPSITYSRPSVTYSRPSYTAHTTPRPEPTFNSAGHKKITFNAWFIAAYVYGLAEIIRGLGFLL